MFFIVVHYTLGLPSDYNIVFVIIQEFFKISSFVYVVYFYLKHAVNYTEENRGSQFVQVMKIFLAFFVLVLGITLFIWVVLRVVSVIKGDPCRDWTWLIYRSVTLVLICTVVTVGIIVQQKVKQKTKEKFGIVDPDLVNDNVEDTFEKVHFNSKAQNTGEYSNETNKFDNSSHIRRLKTLNRSL